MLTKNKNAYICENGRVCSRLPQRGSGAVSDSSITSNKKCRKVNFTIHYLVFISFKDMLKCSIFDFFIK